MKILYFANHGNAGFGDDTEGHIAHAFAKLGHEVVCVKEDALPLPPVSADFFLFHKGGPRIQTVLENVKIPKVCWYFDKVWKDRPRWMAAILPKIDWMFMTDATWAGQSGYTNISILRQGVGDRDTRAGTPNPALYPGKIAFLGTPYDGRESFVSALGERYGEDFKIYRNVFNRELYDLCATVSITVAPPYPSDDHYWSSRVYITLGSGGFLIHPRLAGLAKEYKEGRDFVAYSTMDELFGHIDYFLAHSRGRQEIQRQGYLRTHAKCTYTHRAEKLLQVLKEKGIVHV